MDLFFLRLLFSCSSFSSPCSLLSQRTDLWFRFFEHLRHGVQTALLQGFRCWTLGSDRVAEIALICLSVHTAIIILVIVIVDIRIILSVRISSTALLLVLVLLLLFLLLPLLGRGGRAFPAVLPSVHHHHRIMVFHPTVRCRSPVQGSCSEIILCGCSEFLLGDDRFRRGGRAGGRFRSPSIRLQSLRRLSLWEREREGREDRKMMDEASVGGVDRDEMEGSEKNKKDY